MSYAIINEVSKALADQIWHNIKQEKYLKGVLHSRKQISHQLPKDNNDVASIAVFPYNISEYQALRNQPQDLAKPRTLLYLKVNYLILPTMHNAEEDLIVLGKIMQLFAEHPVLRGSELEESLIEKDEELRLALDSLSMEDLHRLWTLLWAPLRPSVSYSVYPVKIQSSTAPKKSSTPISIKSSSELKKRQS